MRIVPALFNTLFKTRNDLAKSFNEDQMENILIEVATKNWKNHLVGVIYIPLRKHSNNVLESLNFISIDRCITESKNIANMGISISNICFPRSK